jgi:predicted RecA/RadA family phage recombinase
MGFINFDVVVISPPEVDFSVSATPTALTIGVDEIKNLSLNVLPGPGVIVAGAIAGAILAVFSGPAGSALTVTVVFAVATLLKQRLEDGIKNYLKGKTKTIEFSKSAEPIGYTISLKEIADVDVDIRVTAETLQLSTYNGMLMATGTVKVS